MAKEIKKTTTTTKKEWTPNENQAKVLEILKNYPDGAMLVVIEIDTGVKVATGVMTALMGRGLIVATEVDRVSDIVYRDTIIGHKTDHVKKYSLANVERVAE